MRYRYVAAPHPHLVIAEIVAPDVYETMRFPDERLEPGANWGLTSADAQYADVLADPAWRALHDMLRGEAFVSSVLQSFALDMEREGCLVDPDRARLTSFVESRDEKERDTLVVAGDPNDLFTRLDFQSKRAGGYREFVHLDWARRIVGGETALYRDRAFRNDRWCHDPELVALFRPKHNTGVIFLNSNSGFHGPRAITALRGRRRWLYYTISSRSNIWPCAARETVDSLPSHSPGSG